MVTNVLDKFTNFVQYIFLNYTALNTLYSQLFYSTLNQEINNKIWNHRFLAFLSNYGLKKSIMALIQYIIIQIHSEYINKFHENMDKMHIWFL